MLYSMGKRPALCWVKVEVEVGFLRPGGSTDPRWETESWAEGIDQAGWVIRAW